MSYTILHQILEDKKKWISDNQKKYPLNSLQSQIKISKRNFYHALLKNKHKIKFILECKQSSPSSGKICNNFDPIKIANIYKNYCSAISILTDSKYFLGNFNILKKISQITTQPILCKDFFISEWQIYFARIHQADAILLILSILDDKTYCKLSKIAHSLCMGILTEISNETELKRAKYLKAKIIGINNRNLNDFTINLNRTITLSKYFSKKITIISESGIKNYCQIRRLIPYVKGFLIGTTLMKKQSQLNMAINKLIIGENKICGLTRIEDAIIAYKLGAIYGGLIFVPNSPRYININTAQSIISYVKKLLYVGIFQNANISHIVNIVKLLNLSAVQLHGSENQNYINILHKQLPISCLIWKSINMINTPFPQFNLMYIHRYILDSGAGTGKTFDWTYLSNIKQLDQIILAGGLTIKNCIGAIRLNCAGLDFNSGVEITPRRKNHQKIKKIFQILRSYYNTK